MSKSNVLASRFLLVVFSVVLSQKYSGGDHHWYEFLCRVRGCISMNFGRVVADQEASVVRVHLPCREKCLRLIK